MEAKDTVMSDEQMVAEMESRHWGSNTILHRTSLDEREIQAEISFKEGMREVVEWIEGMIYKEVTFDPDVKQYYISSKRWQAKLKDWGVKMKARDTLFHINWGDGDNTFIIAPDEKTAKGRMPDGKDMVNSVVKLDALYKMIFKAGIREVVSDIVKLMDCRLKAETFAIKVTDYCEAKLKEVNNG